jgi:hypothetical protein
MTEWEFIVPVWIPLWLNFQIIQIFVSFKIILIFRIYFDFFDPATRARAELWRCRREWLPPGGVATAFVESIYGCRGLRTRKSLWGWLHGGRVAPLLQRPGALSLLGTSWPVRVYRSSALVAGRSSLACGAGRWAPWQCRHSPRQRMSGSHHLVPSETMNKVTVLGFLSHQYEDLPYSWHHWSGWSVVFRKSLSMNSPGRHAWRLLDVMVFDRAHPCFFWQFNLRGTMAKHIVYCHYGTRLLVHGEVRDREWHESLASDD